MGGGTKKMLKKVKVNNISFQTSSFSPSDFLFPCSLRSAIELACDDSSESSISEDDSDSSIAKDIIDRKRLISV